MKEVVVDRQLSVSGGESIAAPAVAPPFSDEWAGVVAQAGRLALVALQLGLAFVVLRVFALEEASGIHRVTPVLFAGFLIHAIAPARFRLPLFVGIAAATFAVALGTPAAVVLGSVLVLIGVCHLAVPFWTRVSILTVVAAALAYLHAVRSPQILAILPGNTLPILASMVMFRLVIYMYDLRHERGSISVWMRIAYFFLPPNVFFLLFPIVDFQTFRRTYFDRPPVDIYQKGVSWIFRGITHLLAYRFVYYYLVPDPIEVYGIGQVTMFVVTAWLIYLHVSGVFHLVIGILCMFGFNLPETHRLYFLASSPTEIWKRANIYWKDFMTKVFYFPIYKALQKRKVGMRSSIVVATAGVFAATWFLHSYQWFWLLGKFPLSLVHVAFWTMFALLVLASTLLDLKRARQRPGSVKWSIVPAATHTLRVMAMFALMAVMWSWWNTSDYREWLYLLGTAREGRPVTFAAIGVAFVGILAGGIVLHYFASRGKGFLRLDADTPFRVSAGIVLTGTLALIVLASDPVARLIGTRAALVVEHMKSESLNRQDMRKERRSYYEAIITTDQPTSRRAQLRLGREFRPEPQLRASAAVRNVGGVLGYELRPLSRWVHPRYTLSTNGWGMRDREYSVAKPNGAWRAGVVGASVVMGWGTPQEMNFESVVEDRLNRERPFDAYSRYELLNFSVGGYSLIHFVEIAETRAAQFDVDVLIFPTLEQEQEMTRTDIAERVMEGGVIPAPFADLVERAGIRRSSSESAILRRLSLGSFPYELHALGYRRIVEACRRRGIVPVFVFLPPAVQRSDPAAAEIQLRAARDAGFFVVDLRDVFRGADKRVIGFDDDWVHPTAAGHALIARRLYETMIANPDAFALTSPMDSN